MLSRKHLFIAALFLSCLVLHAQTEEGDEPIEDVSTNGQVWIDYNVRHEISDSRFVSGFIGYRSINPHIYNRFVLAPTYHFRHTKPLSLFNLKTPIIHSFQLGGGLFYTDFFETPDNFELRFMQGFQIFTPEWKGMYIKNYVRIEQRLQKLMDDSNWSFSSRLRYQLSTVLEWKKTNLPILKGLYIPLSVEFFFNFNKAERNNDQIRISPGIGYKFNSLWRAEISLGYHNSTNTSSIEETTNDLVLRLRLFNSGERISLFRKSKSEQIKDLMEQ